MLLAASLLVVTGCGGSDKDEPSNTTVAAPPTTAVDVSQDQAKVDAAVLKAEDFPANWERTPAEPEDQTADDSDAKVAACLGLPDPSTVQTADASSDTFTLNQTTIVSSSVTAYKTEADAETQFNATKDESKDDCFVDEFKSLLADGLDPSLSSADLKVEVSRITGLATDDNSQAIRLKLAGSPQTQGQSIYFDILATQSSRFENDVLFLTVGAEPDATLESDLLANAKDRVQKVAS